VVVVEREKNESRSRYFSCAKDEEVTHAGFEEVIFFVLPLLCACNSKICEPFYFVGPFKRQLFYSSLTCAASEFFVHALFAFARPCFFYPTQKIYLFLISVV
jgi:hypothetical protein